MINAIKKHYSEMWWVYLIAFFIGFDSVSFITQAKLKKDYYGLSSAQLASIGVLFGLPWSIKTLYSLLISMLKINRNWFIVLGGALMALAVSLQLYTLIDLSANFYGLLALSAFIYSSGMVISDIILDTRMINIAGQDVDYLGKSALRHRIFMIIGGLLAAILSAYASKLDPMLSLSTKLLLPLMIIIYGLKSKMNDDVFHKISNYLKILGIGFGVVSLLLVLFDQQFLFMLATMAFLYFYVKKEVKITKEFAFACIAVFCFRVIPGVGEAYTWWLMNGLGAKEEYLSQLAIVANIATVGGLALMSRFITKAPLYKCLILLTILDVVLNAPSLLVYYFGYNYKYWLLFESSSSNLLASISMIPLHILLSKNAPIEGRLIYVAASASFVNLALSLGNIITKWANQLIVVTETNFENLGLLMLATMLVSIIFSVIGIVLLRGIK